MDHSFLTPEAGAEVVTIGRLVNAFFRWELNSCETLVAGGEVYPIDYASAGASYEEKLAAYRKLADAYFESERYYDFCASRLSHIDEAVLDWAAGPDCDRLLIQTVRSVYPAHEHDQFIAHLRGLLGLWVRDESARLRNV